MKPLQPGSRLIIDLLGVLTLLALRGWTVLLGLATGLLLLCMVQKRIARVWQGLLLASPFLLAAAVLGLVQEEGGLLWAGYLVTKLMVIVIWTRWLLADFDEQDLIRGMRQLRIPHLFATTIFFIFRYRGILGEEMAELRRARAMRGGAMKRRFFHLGEYRVLGDVIGAGLVRSLDRGDRVYQAMRLRGMTPNSLVHTGETLQNDLWILVVVVALAVGVVWLDGWVIIRVASLA
jgi:cobalt/nickel transport system permease protein